MPTKFELGIDAAKLRLIIGSTPYELVSEPKTIQIPGSPENLSFHFKYEGKYSENIDLGTPRQIVENIEQMFAGMPGIEMPTEAESLWNQWNDLIAGLTAVPFFDQALATITETRIQITEIELRLTPKKVNGVERYESEFRFGLMFTPGVPPRLFNIQVKAFGATLRAKLTIDKAALTRLGDAG